jgi:hypothetical protein
VEEPPVGFDKVAVIDGAPDVVTATFAAVCELVEDAELVAAMSELADCAIAGASPTDMLTSSNRRSLSEKGD